MKVAVVGYAVEGQSAVEYWLGQGAEVTVCDQKTDIALPEGCAAQLGAHYLDNLDRFDLVVRTVGMHPKVILAANPGLEAKMSTNLNEFLRVCPTKNIIGVTGTKGKGTTCALITKMLEAAGKQVFLGGNYGVPAFRFLSKLTKDSWVVLELSSFMLYDIKYSPHIGVCLMVTPEHLDWHGSEQDYYQAKTNLFRWQTPTDIAIYYADDARSRDIALHSPGKHIPYFTEPGAFVKDNQIIVDNKALCKVSELRLLGKHNWQNVCAAVTATWQVTQNVDAMRSALTSFTGLEHRLEFVREREGVQYYDDSFGTTPETAIVAMEAFTQPKVLILGGSDKGADFGQLAEAVRDDKVRQAVIIGDTAPQIIAALQRVGFTHITTGPKTMTEIVQTAKGLAQPGDVVLLSTACASFGLFKNYKDRGEQFKAAVNSL